MPFRSFTIPRPGAAAEKPVQLVSKTLYRPASALAPQRLRASAGANPDRDPASPVPSPPAREPMPQYDFGRIHVRPAACSGPRVLQRRCAACAEEEILQRKPGRLLIGGRHDPLEGEADRVANAITRSWFSPQRGAEPVPSVTGSATPSLLRQPDEGSEFAEPVVNTAAAEPQAEDDEIIGDESGRPKLEAEPGQGAESRPLHVPVCGEFLFMRLRVIGRGRGK